MDSVSVGLWLCAVPKKMNKAVCICAFVVLSQRIYYVQSLPGEYQTKSVADTKNDLTNGDDEDYYAEHDFLKYFGAVPSDSYKENLEKNHTSGGNEKLDDLQNLQKTPGNEEDREKDLINYYADHDFLKYLGEPVEHPKQNHTSEDTGDGEDTQGNAPTEKLEEETKETTSDRPINTQVPNKTLEQPATSYANAHVHYKTVNKVNNRHKSKYVPAVDPSHAYYQRPRYHFAYGVNDPVTGDKKHHYEKRDGNEVSGQYIFVEPDGHVRTVKYKINQNSGFNAVVLRD